MYIVRTTRWRMTKTGWEEFQTTTKVVTTVAFPTKHHTYGVLQDDNNGDTRNVIRRVAYYNDGNGTFPVDRITRTEIQVADNQWWNQHDLA